MRSERGVSLLEVLLASGVALVFSLALLQVLVPATALEARDAELTRALELAESALEDAQRDSQRPDGFLHLATSAPAFADEEHAVVLVREVVALGPQQKRVTVSLYRASPDHAEPVPERRLIRLGLVVTAP
ncbi:MAG: type II secretion system protein [Candidatus Eremiobacterota bacterium]